MAEAATMLLILIPIAIAWLGMATLAVCLCRVAAMADAERAPREPRGPLGADVVVLEPVPADARARRRVQPRAGRRARPATSRSHGHATIHSIR